MSVVVTGYAGLDYCVRLDRPPQADRTATILSRPAQWPRVGGSPAYVAAALVAAGVADAAPVSWVGGDADGRLYRDRLERLGVRIDGIASWPGRTPVCILATQPDGGCHCLYDPGLAEPLSLDATQRRLVASSDWLCLTIGPAAATREALAAARPQASVVWAVKADARAAPPDLAAQLATRADVIACSRGERDFLAAALAAAGAPRRPRALIETRGRDGVAITIGGATRIVAVAPVDCDDAVGAGDTFLGGYLAALVRGESSPERAVAAGAAAARAMLLERLSRQKGSDAP